MWAGLGAFAALAAGFAWVAWRVLGYDDPRDMLRADDVERGPLPERDLHSRGGRHRRVTGGR